MTEVVVVDNGSTDETREVVLEAKKYMRSVRYVREELPGLGHARNRAVRESAGKLILFTDDDVEVPRTWIADMTAPILSGQYDAVAGGIKLADELVPSWLEPGLRARLASTEPGYDQPLQFIGANFSFHRRVLDRVPFFDPELGPGALGGADDTLFGRQLTVAGFKIAFRPDTLVTHHFDAARLSREAWLRDAKVRGESSAYLIHHWHHSVISWPRLKILRKRLQLMLYRLCNRRGNGAAEAELAALQYIHMLRFLLKIEGLARNYEREGLVKLRGVLPDLRDIDDGART